MTFAHFNLHSKNDKTGDVAGTTLEESTCPNTCSLKFRRDQSGNIELDKNGNPKKGPCYAKHGPISWHWKKVSNGNYGNYRDILSQLKKLPRSRLIRHKFAGDDPHINGNVIESDYMHKVECTGRNPHIDYTHHEINKHNLTIWKKGQSRGFVQNLSADNLQDADKKYDTGLPVTVVIPENAPKVSYTPKGRKIVCCPAKAGKIQCVDCRLCSKERPYIIGFRAHGTMKKSLSIAVQLSN
tara:strand:- start:413 stop:1132 length:720 start_codon:yes stop_codon:yes gene_type:complete